jgi:hypothetical protein
VARAGAGSGTGLNATSLVTLLVVISVSACVKRVVTSTATIEVGELRQEDALRVAANLPAKFTIMTPAATPRDCPRALRDDRLNARLTLRRALLIQVQDAAGVAHRPFGDYAVEPAAQYGEKDGEGLRVDCGELRGVGVVTLIARLP